MNRRIAIKYFTSLLLFGVISNRQRSTVLKPCTVTLKCRSKLYNHKIYENINEFWEHHFDHPAGKVNRWFVKNGWLNNFVTKNSKLLPDKKSVEIKMTFASIVHKKIYCLAYRKQRSKYEVQSRENIEYYEVIHC